MGDGVAGARDIDRKCTKQRKRKAGTQKMVGKEKVKKHDCSVSLLGDGGKEKKQRRTKKKTFVLSRIKSNRSQELVDRAASLVVLWNECPFPAGISSHATSPVVSYSASVCLNSSKHKTTFNI